MKPSVMFIIAAIVLVLISILSLLAPVAPAMFGAVDAAQYFAFMVAAVGWLSLGVIAWLARNAEASKTRDTLILGYTLLFGLWAVVSLIGQFGQFGALPAHGASWVVALVQALIAVGFLVARRSSRS